MTKTEVDAWWGSCSIRALIPSIAGSFLLTCLILAAAWLAELHGVAAYIVAALLILAWIALLLNWAYRMFGYNYRLTTHRLFLEKGLLRRKIQQVNLDQVVEVSVLQGPYRFLNVGQIRVTAHGSASQTVVLRGVVAPKNIADRIRALAHTACGLAREDAKPQAGQNSG